MTVTKVEIRRGTCDGVVNRTACNADAAVGTCPGRPFSAAVNTSLQSTGAGDGLWVVVVDGMQSGDEGSSTLVVQ